MLKATLQIGLKKYLLLKKVKNTVPWTYVIDDLTVKKLQEHFNEKELQKTNQEEFRIEKVIKRKGDKLYVNSFNSWTNKKDLVSI